MPGIQTFTPLSFNASRHQSASWVRSVKSLAALGLWPKGAAARGVVVCRASGHQGLQWSSLGIGDGMELDIQARFWPPMSLLCPLSPPACNACSVSLRALFARCLARLQPIAIAEYHVVNPDDLYLGLQSLTGVSGQRLTLWASRSRVKSWRPQASSPRLNSKAWIRSFGPDPGGFSAMGHTSTAAALSLGTAGELRSWRRLW